MKIQPERIDWYNRAFDVATAYTAAQLAQLAYKDDVDVARAVDFDGYAHGAVHIGPEDAYWWSNGESLAIAFRGTEVGISDWVTNLMAGRVYLNWCPDGMHKGFARFGSALVTEVMGAVRRAFDVSENQLSTIFLAGHSKGGALANAAAQYLVGDKFVDPARIHVYSVGSPRVFGRDHVPTFAHQRIVELKDPIPAMPLPIRYAHRGHLHVIDVVGRYDDVGPDGSIAAERISQLLSLGNASGWLARLVMLRRAGKKHSVGGTYVRGLQRIAVLTGAIRLEPLRAAAESDKSSKESKPEQVGE